MHYPVPSDQVLRVALLLPESTITNVPPFVKRQSNASQNGAVSEPVDMGQGTVIKLLKEDYNQLPKMGVLTLELIRKIMPHAIAPPPNETLLSIKCQVGFSALCT